MDGSLLLHLQVRPYLVDGPSPTRVGLQTSFDETRHVTDDLIQRCSNRLPIFPPASLLPLLQPERIYRRQSPLPS